MFDRLEDEDFNFPAGPPPRWNRLIGICALAIAFLIMAGANLIG